MLAAQFLPLVYRSVFVFCLWVWQSDNFKVLKSQSGPKTIMYNALCTYRISSPISRDPESQGLYTRLKLPPQKSKTIGYKLRAKLLIVTGHLSKRTSRKT